MGSVKNLSEAWIDCKGSSAPSPNGPQPNTVSPQSTREGLLRILTGACLLLPWTRRHTDKPPDGDCSVPDSKVDKDSGGLIQFHDLVVRHPDSIRVIRPKSGAPRPEQSFEPALQDGWLLGIPPCSAIYTTQNSSCWLLLQIRPSSASAMAIRTACISSHAKSSWCSLAISAGYAAMN